MLLRTWSSTNKIAKVFTPMGRGCFPGSTAYSHCSGRKILPEDLSCVVCLGMIHVMWQADTFKRNVFTLRGLIKSCRCSSESVGRLCALSYAWFARYVRTYARTCSYVASYVDLIGRWGSHSYRTCASNFQESKPDDFSHVLSYVADCGWF